MIEGVTAAPRPDEAAPEEDAGLPKASAAALYGFFLLFFFALFVGPIATFVIWWRRRDEPFIDLHGRQALDLTLTALIGGLILITGRVIAPDAATAGTVLEWAGFVIVAAQVIQAIWGLIDAARGGDRGLLLSLRILRRGGVWAPMD